MKGKGGREAKLGSPTKKLAVALRHGKTFCFINSVAKDWKSF